MTHQTKIAFLWHMHQPVYTNPETGIFDLPWVRLHGLKDYYGMAKILDDFPNIHVTFNLVPCLLTQLQSYLKGNKDHCQIIFRKNAAELTDEELIFLDRHFFSAHFNRLIQPYPRYAFLFNKRKSNRKKGIHPRNRYLVEEIRDIQVWFTLCYFDEIYKENDPRIRGLIEKGKNFSEADKMIIEKVETELLGAIIPLYRRLVENGKIEISTSPFYHPILPLLIDPKEGRIANPELPDYRLTFNWEDDADAQLTSAVSYMETLFEKKIAGIWPSEGSLSQKVLELMSKKGIQWTATDELNLSRSLNTTFERNDHLTVPNPWTLYKPYRVPHSGTKIFFRDHYLSDAISFKYQHMSPIEAAEDLMKYINAVSNATAGEPQRTATTKTNTCGSPVIPIILDGENAWEYYENSGRDFLKECFTRISQNPNLEMVTFSQCLEMETGYLTDFHSGSWINGNFDIWIGHREDRRAWRLLKETRDCFQREKHRIPERQQHELKEYLYAAEGSDWFWWYGKENYSADLAVFDALFRSNLKQIYKGLGMVPPGELSVPIPHSLRKKR